MTRGRIWFQRIGGHTHFGTSDNGERHLARTGHHPSLPRGRGRPLDGDVVRLRHRHDVCPVPPHLGGGAAGRTVADPMAGLLPLRRRDCSHLGRFVPISVSALVTRCCKKSIYYQTNVYCKRPFNDAEKNFELLEIAYPRIVGAHQHH